MYMNQQKYSLTKMVCDKMDVGGSLYKFHWYSHIIQKVHPIDNNYEKQYTLCLLLLLKVTTK